MRYTNNVRLLFVHACAVLLLGAVEIVHAQPLRLFASLSNFERIPSLRYVDANAAPAPMPTRRQIHRRRPRPHSFVFDPPRPRIVLPHLRLPNELAVMPMTSGAIFASSNIILSRVGTIQPELAISGAWFPGSEQTELTTTIGFHATAARGWMFRGQLQGFVSAAALFVPQGSLQVSITTPRVGPVAVGFDGAVNLSSDSWTEPQVRVVPRLGIVGGRLEVTAAIGLESAAAQTLPIVSMSLSWTE